MNCSSSLIALAVITAALAQADPGIAIASSFGVVLKPDGTVWTWGKQGESWGLEQMPDVSGLRSVAAGEDSVLALKPDGTVLTWGYSSMKPTAVAGLSGIVQIAAASQHWMALDGDGVVWGWGEVPERKPLLVPTRVEGLPKIVAIAAGDKHSIAIDAAGSVWVWGDHGAGDLGDHCYNISQTPQKLPAVPDTVAVTGGYEVTFGLKKDGTVWAIGYGAAGQMGNGSTQTSTKVVTVAGLTGVKGLAARYMHVMALKKDGTVWGWGDNHYHELGNTRFTEELASTPVEAPGLTGVTAIAAGSNFSAAFTGKGEVWTWGQNDDGALGADPEALERSDEPMQPGTPIPPTCEALFQCLTGSGKVIRICGTQDPNDVGKWSAIHYRFGPETGPPELMFPEDPENAPPSLFFSEARKGEWRVEVSFANGAYRYRVYYGEKSGGGVIVQSATGRPVSTISCAERPELYGSYLKANLPPAR